ncbi:ATP-binding protein [Streptomyces sp. CS014]|uniref:ATP-binding protein n=1 Tax=Streptomyces sp. CS014 TaxID=2162707 RepID=UPI0013A53421|nr:ATP-binding protein [Streptomyces sp. CS014]
METPYGPARFTPAPVGPPRYRGTYPRKATSPTRARNDAAAAVGAWGLDVLSDTVQILVSEMVTNALVHTSTPRIGMTLTRTGPHTVRVAVTDNASTVCAGAEPDEDDENGRGLLLIEALASRWGQTPTPGGKQVWAELDTHHGEGP